MNFKLFHPEHNKESLFLADRHRTPAPGTNAPRPRPNRFPPSDRYENSDNCLEEA